MSILKKFSIIVGCVFICAGSVFGQAGEWEDNSGISAWTNGSVGIWISSPQSRYHVSDGAKYIFSSSSAHTGNMLIEGTYS